MRTTRQLGFPRSMLAAAMLAVFAPAWAEDDAAARLARPDTGGVSVGAGGISGDPRDRSLFTQYNGLHKDDAYYLFFGANDIQNDQQSGGLGVARAGHPGGPFVDYLGHPLVDKFHNGAATSRG